MRYNLNIFYRTSELKKGSMNHIPFTWNEIPKFKNNDPLEIELMIGDRIIYSDPTNKKNIYNGMTAIITKITPEFSLSQRRNLLTNRYLNRFINNQIKQKNTEKYGGGGSELLYDIDFLLDEIEEEEIDYLNIEGKTKTKKKGLKNIDRKYLLGYTQKSLIIDIDSTIQDEQIIKDKVSTYLKNIFLRKNMIPKYVDKNKYKFENMKEWRMSNSFNTKTDINIDKNVIRDTRRRDKNRTFKKNNEIFLIEDLMLENLKILNSNKSNNNYTQKDINKLFYREKKLKKNVKLLNKTKSYLTKIYGESVVRKKSFFEKLLKKEDIFGLEDAYGYSLNKEAIGFVDVIMQYISIYMKEKIGFTPRENDEIFTYIKGKIGRGFLKNPLIRQLFIIKKILSDSGYLDYRNKKLKTKIPKETHVKNKIDNIFQKIFFNKSIINIEVYIKFYLKKGESSSSLFSIGSSCNKRKDIMDRDVNTFISNLGLAWNEGKTKIGGKTKKRKRRNKKTKKKKKGVKRRLKKKYTRKN